MSQLRDEFFQPKEAKERVGISESTLYRWRDAGLIQSTKVRGKVFFSVSQIRKLLTPEGTTEGTEKSGTEKV